MFLNFFRILVLIILNYILILRSKYIDTYQLFEDINRFIQLDNASINLSYYIISISVSLLTVTLIRFFKPFIEIYLLHYSRYLFYLLISLISLSSVYIVLRVYGYSRTWMVFYLFFVSVFLMFSEKIVEFVRIFKSRDL
jgi:hypothetical protein